MERYALCPTYYGPTSVRDLPTAFPRGYEVYVGAAVSAEHAVRNNSSSAAHCKE